MGAIVLVVLVDAVLSEVLVVVRNYKCDDGKSLGVLVALGGNPNRQEFLPGDVESLPPLLVGGFFAVIREHSSRHHA